MLARPSAGGFETYMARRSGRSAFAADAFVFPGGAVETQDFAPAIAARTHGLDDERIAALFRASVPAQLPSTEPAIDRTAARALLNAALRELFEEAGILFVQTPGGSVVNASQIRSDDVAKAREEMVGGNLTFAEFLDRHGWFADTTALTLFSHWITPPSEPRRFNTHFFLALAPEGQAGRADAVEMHEGVWVAPRDALERYRTGNFHLVYPTIKHLERLASFDSLGELQDFARRKPVLTILPETASGGGFAMPGGLENAW
jgi:8-oxo-dGTP pyrophosphatase MutT (NUDIX family)